MRFPAKEFSLHSPTVHPYSDVLIGFSFACVRGAHRDRLVKLKQMEDEKTDAPGPFDQLFIRRHCLERP